MIPIALSTITEIASRVVEIPRTASATTPTSTIASRSTPDPSVQERRARTATPGSCGRSGTPSPAPARRAAEKPLGDQIADRARDESPKGDRDRDVDGHAA